MDAQLIWLTTGFLEYRFPINVSYPFRTDIERIEFSFEICSEAYGYNEFWPSDISIWINNQEIGCVKCPGDHGGRRGQLNPDWWSSANTQFGDLAKIVLLPNGCTVNADTTTEHTLHTLLAEDSHYISLKIGVKKDTQYCGGMNLFGSGFGDYPQAIVMKIYGKAEPPEKHKK